MITTLLNRVSMTGAAALAICGLFLLIDYLLRRSMLVNEPKPVFEIGKTLFTSIDWGIGSDPHENGKISSEGQYEVVGKCIQQIPRPGDTLLEKTPEGTYQYKFLDVTVNSAAPVGRFSASVKWVGITPLPTEKIDQIPSTEIIPEAVWSYSPYRASLRYKGKIVAMLCEAHPTLNALNSTDAERIVARLNAGETALQSI